MKKHTPFVKSANGYNYLRFKKQPLVELPRGAHTTPEFKDAYKRALALAQARDRAKPARQTQKKAVAPVGTTVQQAIAFFYDGPTWRALKPRTRTLWGIYLNAWNLQYGPLGINDLTREDMRAMLRNRTINSGAGAARNWLIAVRALMRDRIEADLMKEDNNPVLGMKGPQLVNKDGHPTWEPEDIDQYRRFYPSGTPQRLAIEMLYWTGASCCDVIRLTLGMVKVGVFEFKREKTAVDCYPHLQPDLAAEITACGLDDQVGVILRTETGLAFKSPQYFSDIFRRWCKKAGITKGLSAHGIRKRTACDAAEIDEWTNDQIKAKLGWKSSQMVDLYTDKAKRKRIARASVVKARTA